MSLQAAGDVDLDVESSRRFRRAPRLGAVAEYPEYRWTAA